MREFLNAATTAFNLQEAGDFSRAAAVWDTVRKVFPDEPVGYLGGAAACKNLGKIAEAEELLAEALRRFPGHSDAALNYAVIAAEREDWEQLRCRWGAIPGECTQSLYFALSWRLFLLSFVSGDSGKEQYFQTLLKEPIGLAGRAIPIIISETLNIESDHTLFTQITDWIREKFVHTPPTTPVSELIILILQFPHVDRNTLLMKWCLDENLRRQFALFQNINVPNGIYVYGNKENYKTLQNVAGLIIERDIAKNLSPQQAYNFALLLSVEDQDLCDRFIASALKERETSPGFTNPLSVLTHIRNTRSAVSTGAPALIGKKRLRIALCVSGQLRGFQAAGASWKDFGFDVHQVDTFVHTWRMIGRKFPFVYHADRTFVGSFLAEYRRVASILGQQVLFRRYPTFFGYFLNGGNEISAQELQDFYGTNHVVIEDDRKPPFNCMNNAEKMYYKTEACFGLAEATGNSYDLVIRIRPDKPVIAHAPVDWTAIHRDVCHNRKIFTDSKLETHWLIGYLCGDQFAVGDAECMAHYSRAHTFTREASENNFFGYPRAYLGHNNFAYLTFFNGIRVDELGPIKFGTLQDPHIVDPRILKQLLEYDLQGKVLNEFDQALLTACDRD